MCWKNRLKSKQYAKKASRKKNTKAKLPADDTAGSKVEAETPIIDSKASKVQAEMQEQTIDTNQAVVDAQWRASKTRIAADKAIAELRRLRDGGNASKTEIDTARPKITSTIKKAAITKPAP